MRTIGFRSVACILSCALLLALCGCASKENKADNAFLKKALEEAANKQNDKPAADPEEPAEEPAQPEEPEEAVEKGNIYEQMSIWRFIFSSGAGGWETHMDVLPDGSFSGEYYDSDMGSSGPGYDNGTFYQCVFHGRFGAYEEVSPYIYKVQVDSLEYENEVGREEIKDDMLYVYTGAYGLEGLTDHKNELYVYLPGAPLAQIPEEYMSWVTMTHFGTTVGEDYTFVQDNPTDLPFCGIYNTEGYGFFSDNETAINGTYLTNRAKMPGLVSEQKELNKDGTYKYVDMDPYGMFSVTNACVRLDEDYETYTDDGGDKFVRACLKELDMQIPEDLYVYSTYPTSASGDRIKINGYYAFQASWNEGSNEDSRHCMGCFLKSANYEGDCWFGYSYIISRSQYDDTYGGELAYFYLSSLELTGRSERLSCAGTNKADSKILVQAISSKDSSKLRAEEVLWVTEEDTDLIEEYHLDPDEFFDDYQIAGFDGSFQDYPVAKDCVFYVQYPEDRFHKLLDYDAFNRYVGRFDNDDGLLMNFILDDTGTVVAVYEPYTP